MNLVAPSPFWSKFTLRILTNASLLLLAGHATAAATSSTLNGRVISENGETVADAVLSIVHEPSGTATEARSNSEGMFYESGLRIGGPYIIKVSADAFLPVKLEGVSLSPGLQSNFVIALTPTGGEEELVVVASPLESVDLNEGVGSSYTSRDIANHPTTKRDVIQTLLRDPLAQSQGEGNLSVAGVNPRFNGLAIDGSLQQDDFGLGSSTYATRRSPINLDAIESVSLVASDYSVSASGFTGGLVNITTKSGTNSFRTSAFYYTQNEGNIGETYDGNRNFSLGAYDETEIGFTLGGPIIEDRMFFFVSYDEYESASTTDFGSFDASNGIASGFWDGLRQIILDTYDYDPGSRPRVANTPVGTERVLVKFDWNVSKFHRASLTYQSTQEHSTLVNGSAFTSNWVDIPVDLNSQTIQLFSDWSASLSSEFRLNLKTFERGQNCRAGPGVGAIEIHDLAPNDLIGSPLEGMLGRSIDIFAGCDRFRHANAYNDERLQLFLAAHYAIENHIFTFGFERESFDLLNLFVPSSAGRFRFEASTAFSVFDRLLRRTARVDYVNVPSNVASDGAAAWGYTKNTFFVHDSWQISPSLIVSGGVRIENFAQDDAPKSSSDIQVRYGIDSSSNLDGLRLVMPRISFNWNPRENTVISGGVGLFSGGDPKVWTSNAFQPFTAYASERTIRSVSFTEVPQLLQDRVASSSGVPIDVISPDFNIPSDWKMSVKLEQTINLQFGEVDLGENYLIVAQFLRTRTRHGFLWTNLAQTQIPGINATGVAPDGRPIYADLEALRSLNLTQLGNFEEGASNVFTIGVSKAFDFGLDITANAAYQDVEAVTEGVSSRGISNWRSLVTTDRNNPEPRTSPYEVEQSYKLYIGYQKQLLNLGIVRADLIGRVFSNYPYTLTFDTWSGNSLFGRAGAGESPYDNSPLYIPDGRNDPRVVYGTFFNKTAFFNFIESLGVKPGIHEPNSAIAGWNRSWDFRLQLKATGFSSFFSEGRSLKFVLDIENLLNFLNDEWGVYENGPAFGQAPIVRADLVSAVDVAKNGIHFATPLLGDVARAVCTTENACLYRFNEFRSQFIRYPNGSRSVYRLRFGFRLDF